MDPEEHNGTQWYLYLGQCGVVGTHTPIFPHDVCYAPGRLYTYPYVYIRLCSFADGKATVLAASRLTPATSRSCVRVVWLSAYSPPGSVSFRRTAAYILALDDTRTFALAWSLAEG